MSEIHLIEKKNLITPIGNSADEYESGYWSIKAQTAQRLKDAGAGIYFHKKQKEPPFRSGKIIDYRMENKCKKYKGRIVFMFKEDSQYKKSGPDPTRWGNEKKFVWSP